MSDLLYLAVNVLADQVSGTTGTATRATLTKLDVADLAAFDHLRFHLKSSVSLIGTSPTFDLYLQRAIRPNPDAADDDDWADFAAFSQVTAGVDEELQLPVELVGNDPDTPSAWSRTIEGLTAGEVRPGHWGPTIRIREKMGGTVTTELTYSLDVVGMIHNKG